MWARSCCWRAPCRTAAIAAQRLRLTTLRDAPADVQNRAAHPCAAGPEEVRDHLRDRLRAAQTQRCGLLACHPLLGRPRPAGTGSPRGDRVHQDAGALQLVCQRRDETVQPRLRGAVGWCHLVAPAPCRTRADDHDPTASAFEEILQQRFRAPPGARKVDIDHTAPQVLVGGERGSERGVEAGNVDERVNVTEFGDGTARHVPSTLGVCDVHLDG